MRFLQYTIDTLAVSRTPGSSHLVRAWRPRNGSMTDAPSLMNGNLGTLLQEGGRKAGCFVHGAVSEGTGVARNI